MIVLRLIGCAQLTIAALVCLFSYHFSSTLEKPAPGTRVTFEMYQAQFAFILILIQQLLPLLAGAFLFFGVAMLFYLRKGQSEK